MNELNWILDLSPLPLLALALVAIGRMLKVVNWHPDKLIPLTLPVLGAVLWVLLSEAVPIAWAEKLKHAWVAYAMLGLVAGTAAVWGNQVWRQAITKKEDAQ